MMNLEIILINKKRPYKLYKMKNYNNIMNQIYINKNVYLYKVNYNSHINKFNNYKKKLTIKI